MRKSLAFGLLTLLLLATIAIVDAAGSAQPTITSEPPEPALTASAPSPGLPQLVYDPAAIQAELDAQLRTEEARRAEAEAAAAAEAQRQADEARRAAPAAPAPVPPAAPPPVVAGTPDDACAGIDWVIPVRIVWRESHCNFDAINYNGCGGWTCVGAYQFDLRHWISRDEGGWGGCAWLGDWHIPQNQIECARQMSHNGTNLGPWGG